MELPKFRRTPEVRLVGCSGNDENSPTQLTCEFEVGENDDRVITSVAVDDTGQGRLTSIRSQSGNGLDESVQARAAEMSLSFIRKKSARR